MAATSDAVAIRELESRLRRPDKGENGYREGTEARTRVDVLARLKEFSEEGKIPREGKPGGINTHFIPSMFWYSTGIPKYAAHAC